jgi:hypothetical protein
MPSSKLRYFVISILLGVVMVLPIAHLAWAQDKKPNIIVIMGDDVGWFNIPDALAPTVLRSNSKMNQNARKESP